jgi:hypothetical protein
MRSVYLTGRGVHIQTLPDQQHPQKHDHKPFQPHRVSAARVAEANRAWAVPGYSAVTSQHEGRAAAAASTQGVQGLPLRPEPEPELRGGGGGLQNAAMAESCHAESDMHSSTEEAKGKEAQPARLHSRLELSRSLTPADEAPRSARLEAKVAAAAAELCRLNALLGC